MLNISNEGKFEFKKHFNKVYNAYVDIGILIRITLESKLISRISDSGILLKHTTIDRFFAMTWSPPL